MKEIADYANISDDCLPPRSRPLSVSIDVGSTVIKGIAVNRDGTTLSCFQPHDERSLREQVIDMIHSFGAEPGKEPVSICSSFNGGLKVGLLCLSKRVSGSTTQHYLEAVGANICYLVEWRDSHAVAQQINVDLLIVVGGIDGFPDHRARHVLSTLVLDAFPHERLIFAGHSALADLFGAQWPEVKRVDNLLDGGLLPNSSTLPEFVRDSYLDDIVSKRDVKRLRDLSIVPILPTPLVVSRAFVRVQEKVLSPVLIFDVGGATTDIHFPRELLDEEQLSGYLSTYPAIARHVFTAYGVSESRSSTIRRLIDDTYCMRLLIALYGKEYRQVYVALLDGDAPEKLLFAACIFLALRDMSLGDEQVPPLQLGRMATVGVTGGAAKCLAEEEVNLVFAAAMGEEVMAQIVVDHRYEWWGLGMSFNNEHVV
jgi:hypothetical protein